MSIRMQAYVSTGICIVLSLVINLGMVHITRGVASDASHSELATQIALLSQRWVNNALFYSRDATRERRADLETTVQALEGALSLMRNGGDGSSRMSSDVTIAPLKDPYAEDLLITATTQLKSLQATTRTLLATGGDRRAEPMRAVERQSEAMVGTARTLSSYLAKKARSTADFMIIVELAALALCLVANMFAFDVGRRLTGAIARLTRHVDSISMGRSDEPVPLRGPGEIAVLAKSIDRMRVSLQKALRMLYESDSGDIARAS